MRRGRASSSTRKAAGRAPSAGSAACSTCSMPPASPPAAPADEPGVERRLRTALAQLREAGVEATGHIGESDPYTAAMNVVHDEQVDEIIVSTFPHAHSGWLRRDLIGRIRSATSKPVTHVVVEPAKVESV